MRKLISTIIMILSTIGLFLSGCTDSDQLNEPHHGSGKIVTQVRNVAECKSINIRYAGNVYLTQDNIQSVRVEADDNIIDNVITQNENGSLSVGLEKGSYNDVTVRIYVSLKTIEGITINGAGNITVQNQITGDQLSCTINGAGDIYLKGSYNKLNCSINGAGNINAFEFPVKSCTASVAGTGNCFVNVLESLDAAIQGIGNISFDGDPTVKSAVSGIGKISHR